MVGRSPFRAIFGVGALLLGASCGSSPAPSGELLLSERLKREEATMLAHPEEVASYTLSAKLDATEHTVHGEGTIHWKNASRAPVSDLWVHLYINAFKNSKSTFLTEVIPGFRGSSAVKHWGSIDVRRFSIKGKDLWPGADRRPNGGDDESEARVPLETALGPGEVLDIDVAWDVALPSIVERTGFDGSFHMVAQWFPKIARLEDDGTWRHFPFHHLAEFSADFGTYDVSLDVPEAFSIGATGARTELGREGGRRKERFRQADVHDFAWTVWDHFRERNETASGVAVRLLYPEGYEHQVERELEMIRFALPHCRARYGPYPYSTLTVVHPPSTAEEAGGMEYPTLITTGGSWSYPRFVHAPELLTIHEFGHQYFYGLVATDEEKWPFLDEGFTSYVEMETLGARFGEGSLGAIGGLRVGEEGAYSVIGARYAQQEIIAKPAEQFRSGNSYGGLIYSRMATLFGTLHRIYGDRFVDALGVYSRRFRFRHPGPEDFLSVMKAELGADTEEFLRRALFHKGWVDYAVSSSQLSRVVEAKGLFDEKGVRSTKEGGAVEPLAYSGFVDIVRKGTLEIPVEVETTMRDGTRNRVTWDGRGESKRIELSGSSGLLSVVVDPDHKVLVDAEPSNNVLSFASSVPSGGSLAISSILTQAIVQVLFR